MGKLFRGWQANAGTWSIGFAFAGVIVLLARQPVAGTALAVLAGVSLIQGLRNLWAASPVKAGLYALGLPAVIVGALLYEGAREFALLAYFAPAALAAAAEWGVRRWRQAHGLPPVAAPAVATPAGTLVPPSRRLAAGCVTLGLLGLGSVALLSWAINAPARQAEAFHATLRPGMSLADVVVAAWPHGRQRYAFVNQAEGAPLLSVGQSAARVGDEYVSGEAAVRALLDRHGPELRVNSVSFSFRGLVPTRAGVTVLFGPDGRVTRIEGPFYHAD